MTKNKPYNSLSEYLLNKYHKKVAKIALNGNFTCPNKDGKKGFGGCSFCSKLGSGDFAGNKNDEIEIQFEKIKAIMAKKWNDTLYIPYLQANSNTYASIDKLKELYEKCINLDEKVVGLDIATRPDCLDDEIINYLGELNKKIDITVELGLQSSNEKTGAYVNRCLTNNEFIEAVNKLKKQNINVVAHIINGLPYETESDMLNTIDFLNHLPIDGIKLHMLLILKDTKMEKDYLENNFHILTLEEYVDIVVKQICMLRPDIIIHRLSADGNVLDLIEPKWTIKKLVVMNEIDKKLRKNSLYQGIIYKAS